MSRQFDVDDLGKHSHLANAFVYLCVAGKLLNFGGSKLEHANIPLFRCDGGFDDIDLPLGGDGLGFNLLNQLFNVSWDSPVHRMKDLTFCNASFGMDILVRELVRSVIEDVGRLGRQI